MVIFYIIIEKFNYIMEIVRFFALVIPKGMYDTHTTESKRRRVRCLPELRDSAAGHFCLLVAGEKYMTEKELRKLSRAELLEMLIDQSSELQDCKERLAAAEAALHTREIAVSKAGSIAEAALSLNGVFETAQRACAQYIENIQQLSARQEAICTKLEEDSRTRAAQLLAEAEGKRADMEKETEIRCAKMEADAKAEAQKYWDDVSTKLKAYCAAHDSLRELLSEAAPSQA